METSNIASNHTADPSLPVDLSGFNDAAGGDPHETLDLLKLYASQLELKMSQITAAVHSGNSQDLKAAAHGLAGASATCGLHDFAKTLRELELCARGEEIEAARHLYARGATQAAGIKAAIETELQRP